MVPKSVRTIGKFSLLVGALLSAVHGASKVQDIRAERILRDILKEREAIGFVHEEKPKLIVKYGFFPQGVYYASKSNTIVLESSYLMLPFDIIDKPRTTLEHETGHSYVAERVKKLNPPWKEKFENKFATKFAYLQDQSIPARKRMDRYWEDIKRPEFEDFLAFWIVNEGIATYFQLRQWYGHDGFTSTKDYREFAKTDCLNRVKEFPKDLGSICATHIGMALVTPSIDKHSPKAIDTILLNLPTIRELKSPAEYHKRIESMLKP